MKLGRCDAQQVQHTTPKRHLDWIRKTSNEGYDHATIICTAMRRSAPGRYQSESLRNDATTSATFMR